jgi:hypothetical protein
MVVHAKNVLLLTRSKWQYFYPIQQGMAKNCSADVSLVIDHIDSVLTTGTADEIHALKDMFGLAGLEHSDDFAAVLPNGPYQWQSNDFYTGYSLFFQWCDAVENAVPGAGTSTPATGVGLEKALAGYANWIKTVIVPTAQVTATQIRMTSPASTHTTPPTLCTPTTPSAIPGTDSGFGSFATSHLHTGKRTSMPLHLNHLISNPIKILIIRQWRTERNTKHCLSPRDT